VHNKDEKTVISFVFTKVKLNLNDWLSAVLGVDGWMGKNGSSLVLDQGCSATKTGAGTPFPHQIQRKTKRNSSNKVSILLQEFPHWIFLSRCRLLTSSANVRICEIAAMFQCNRLDPTSSSNVTSTNRCGNAFPQQKNGMGTPFPRVPTPLHPCA